VGGGGELLEGWRASGGFSSDSTFDEAAFVVVFEVGVEAAVFLAFVLGGGGAQGQVIEGAYDISIGGVLRYLEVGGVVSVVGGYLGCFLQLYRFITGMIQRRKKVTCL